SVCAVACNAPAKTRTDANPPARIAIALSLGDDDLNAAVLLPPFRIVRTVRARIGSDRLLRTKTLGGEFDALQSAALLQPRANGFRAGFRKLLIVRVTALGVGVPDNADATISLIPNDGRRLIQRRCGGRPDIG